MSDEQEVLESPSRLIHRSKSCDNNKTTDFDAQICADAEPTIIPKKKDSNEPQIIVTSFAPNPKAKQLPQPQIVQIRPNSQFNSRSVLNASDTSKALDNQENP